MKTMLGSQEDAWALSVNYSYKIRFSISYISWVPLNRLITTPQPRKKVWTNSEHAFKTRPPDTKTRRKSQPGITNTALSWIRKHSLDSTRGQIADSLGIREASYSGKPSRCHSRQFTEWMVNIKYVESDRGNRRWMLQMLNYAELWYMLAGRCHWWFIMSEMRLLEFICI